MAYNLRRAADIRPAKVFSVADNGKSNGAGNDAHRAALAEANQRAVLAEREAALWRATGEMLRLDRDAWRDEAQRLGAKASARPSQADMARFTARHYRALRLLDSRENGCTEGFMVSKGFSIEIMVDLIMADLASGTTEHAKRSMRIKIVRVKITDAGRRAVQSCSVP